MSQLAVILDNLVKIFENVDGGDRKQAPTGEQQQISQEQHCISPLILVQLLSLLLLPSLTATFGAMGRNWR
jgi:hypothetical protein